MYFDFLNLQVTINLPTGTKLFNKNDSIKTFQMDKTQAQAQMLHFASADDTSNAMLFCLGKVESTAEYKAVVEQFVETSSKAGLKLYGANKVTSTDGRRLDVQQFESKQICLLTVFSVINNQLFLLSNYHKQQHKNQALDFGLEIMKTLAPIK